MFIIKMPQANFDLKSSTYIKKKLILKVMKQYGHELLMNIKILLKCSQIS